MNIVTLKIRGGKETLISYIGKNVLMVMEEMKKFVCTKDIADEIGFGKSS